MKIKKYDAINDLNTKHQLKNLIKETLLLEPEINENTIFFDNETSTRSTINDMVEYIQSTEFSDYFQMEWIQKDYIDQDDIKVVANIKSLKENNFIIINKDQKFNYAVYKFDFKNLIEQGVKIDYETIDWDEFANQHKLVKDENIISLCKYEGDAFDLVNNSPEPTNKNPICYIMRSIKY